MTRYALRRLLVALLTFVGITLITFTLVHLGPGDPAHAGASVGGGGASADSLARIRAHYGLDQPLVRRYFAWLARCVRLDFGRSFRDGRSVGDKLAERLGPTLGLAGAALAIALLIAIPVGMRCAVHAGGWFDRTVGVACFAASAVPRYVAGMVLILIVGVRLGWLPFVGMTSTADAGPNAGGAFDVLCHGMLIGICFIYPIAAYLVRFVRDNLVGVLSADYIRTARAKGASERRVLWRHALPNALLPLLTVMGLLLPSILSGAVILEVMFSWPGMGRLMFDAVMQRDYPVILGTSAVTALVVLVGTLIVDLLYAWADPRVRYA